MIEILLKIVLFLIVLFLVSISLNNSISRSRFLKHKGFISIIRGTLAKNEKIPGGCNAISIKIEYGILSHNGVCL